MLLEAGRKKPFQCPDCFSDVYEKFLTYCEYKGYTDHSRRSLIYPVKKFLTFLDAKKISSMDDILAETITSFMTLYIDCSKIYLKTLSSKLSVFFHFLFENHLVSHELHTFLPDIRYVRDPFIPSSWKKDDVIKLMKSIDRSNPVGKRNYAMLLLVVRLGLRTSDILILKLLTLTGRPEQFI